jgi:CubicO group peptidase (beta-lactamase class C family)
MIVADRCDREGQGVADIKGNWDRRFEGVATALAASLEAGTDVGASVAVLLGGEPVVDIWGGFVDESHSAPWGKDTLTNVWSTTKTMTFLCALMLADRGDLDFHAPVARYWPRCWPHRSPGGSRAPRPATTPSPRAIWSARW